MALYSFGMQMIGRSEGRSATAAAAYRAAVKIECERTGQTFDYTRKQGVLHNVILAPENAPDFAADPAQLWNTVEQAEVRKNSQVARENRLALDADFTLEQNLEMLHGFVQEAYISRGMIAQVSVHAANEEGDERNTHAHVMLTTRELTEDGEFAAKKNRDWNRKETLAEWRELWANHYNAALERAGREERVDHRSFEERGLDQLPTKHFGVAAMALERAGVETEIGQHNAAVTAFNEQALADSNLTLAELEDALKQIEEQIADELARAGTLSEAYNDHAQPLSIASDFNEEAARPDEEEDLYFDRDQYEIDWQNALSDAAIEAPLPDEQTAPEPTSKEQETKEPYYVRYLAELDRMQEHEGREEQKRSKKEQELEAYYKLDEKTAALEAQRTELAKSQGLWAGMTGRRAQLEENIDLLEKSLANATQRLNEQRALYEDQLTRERQETEQRQQASSSPSPAPQPGQKESDVLSAFLAAQEQQRGQERDRGEDLSL